MGEMIKTSTKACKGCRYCKYFNGEKYDKYRYCDYLLMTGKRRACKVGECDKYDKKW